MTGTDNTNNNNNNNNNNNVNNEDNFHAKVEKEIEAYSTPYEETSPKYRRAKMHLSDLGQSKKNLSVDDPIHGKESNADFIAHTYEYFNKSIFTPFFGSNTVQPWETADACRTASNPCEVFAAQVHECLKEKDNNFLFCQSKVATLQKCLFKLKM